MSSSDLESHSARAWGRVWLFGTIVPLAAGLFYVVAWNMWRAAQSDYSGDGWAAGMLGFTVMATVVAAFTALLFVTMVRNAEWGAPKPLLIWLALGFVATTPIAVTVIALVAVSPFDQPRSASEYTAPLIFFYAAGLIGTLTAWRVRRGRWLG